MFSFFSQTELYLYAELWSLVEYNFTTHENMKTAIDDGKFIEWAEYSGNLYGTRYFVVVGVIVSLVSLCIVIEAMLGS